MNRKKKEKKPLSFLGQRKERNDSITLNYQILNYNKFITMNSLRTDDILGAKPTVRHMPKDLIR